MLLRADRRFMIGSLWVRLLDTGAPRIASALRQRWARIRNPHATVEFGPDVYLGPGFSLHAPDGGTFIAERQAQFRRGFRCELAGAGARVRIGAESQLTYDVLIQCTTTIEVGERVMLSQAVMIADGNHRFRDITLPVFAQGYDFRPVYIGDDAVVHAKCTIVASVGERTVVGANTLVNRDLEPFTVAGGVPARVVGRLGTSAERRGDAPAPATPQV